MTSPLGMVHIHINLEVELPTHQEIKENSKDMCRLSLHYQCRRPPPFTLQDQDSNEDYRLLTLEKHQHPQQV